MHKIDKNNWENTQNVDFIEKMHSITYIILFIDLLFFWYLLFFGGIAALPKNVWSY